MWTNYLREVVVCFFFGGGGCCGVWLAVGEFADRVVDFRVSVCLPVNVWGVWRNSITFSFLT